MYRVPDLGEGLVDATIAEWWVDVGDTIAEGQDLVSLESDKAVMVIPSPLNGVVTRILVAAGTRAAVGTAVLEVHPAVSRNAVPAMVAATDVLASPRARALARKAGVDLAVVARAHPGAVLTEDHVAAATRDLPDAERTELPLTHVQQVLGRRLAIAHREVPVVTVVEEADFTDLIARHPGSPVPFVLAAIARAARKVPEVNATFSDGALVLNDRCDVALAVASERGLMAPVVRDVGARCIEDLRADLVALVDGARRGKLPAGGRREASITLTSAGRLGGMFATPIVLPPQVAIVGLHRIEPRPAVVDGAVAVRSIGHLTCSFDHRAVDGHRAAAFLLAMRETLEHDAPTWSTDG